MIGIFRAAVQGMLSSRNWIDVIGGNISNVNTPGYKTTRAEFQDLLYRQLPDTQNGPGPVLQVGSGSDLVATQRLFVQGTLDASNSPTDLAIFGDGFFPVDMPDGTTAYTRNGNFHVDTDGSLVTPSGQRLAAPVAIPPGYDSLEVSTTGEVRVKIEGEADSVLVGQIPLARFANISGLETIGDNMWRPSPNSGPAQT